MAIPDRKDASPESGKSEYGDVAFADPVNKKYPIDTPEHIRAAWSYIHQAKNAAKYDAAAVGSIKERIAAAWRDKIDKAGPPEAAKMQDLANTPRLRKKVVIAKAIGKFTNGPQSGNLSRAVLARMVDTFHNFPRQVPVYLLTGKPDPQHPEDLDDRLADGWVEGLELDGDNLIGDLNLHGDAATAVLTDSVRGASIGTVPTTTYDGQPIGTTLEHVVLTNAPFIKGLNIAARASGEPVAWHFTALPMETEMGEPAKKPADPAAADDGAVNYQERAEALKAIVNEKDETIAELAASRDNLLKEVETYRSNPQLQEAVGQMRQMKRQLLAEKVRRIVTKLCENGQVVRETVKWAFADSDETVLAGFENGTFKGKVELLEFALQTFPKKTMRRVFASGAPDEAASGFTAEEKDQIKAAGKDPDLLEKMGKPKNFTDWKQRRDAAKKE